MIYKLNLSAKNILKEIENADEETKVIILTMHFNLDMMCSNE